MSRVYCAAIECKHCSDKGYCEKNKIGLTFCYVNTVNDGNQNFWKCTSYEERDDESYLQLKEIGHMLAEKVRGEIND